MIYRIQWLGIALAAILVAFPLAAVYSRGGATGVVKKRIKKMERLPV
jgi:hypothetical protein